MGERAGRGGAGGGGASSTPQTGLAPSLRAAPPRRRPQVLHDFFRSAFDGSGADNFYDAGSCIDGRLTSAWNWCNELPRKPYFPLFKLTGFAGFDGEFDS